jgi:cobalamin biosynthesis protein CobD/CbiB
MSYYTTRNIVILALVQLGVISLGVLAAELTRQMSSKWHFRLADPSWTNVWADFGWLALVLPVVWVGAAIYILRRRGFSDQARGWVLVAGFLLLVVVLFVVWKAALREWVRIIQL